MITYLLLLLSLAPGPGISFLVAPPSRMTSALASTQSSIDAFKSWLTNAGVKDDSGVVVGPSSLTGGKGLIATKSISRGSTLVVVPQDLSLSEDTAIASPIGRYIKGWEGWTGETGTIALQLLWERALGEKSTISPWINILPSTDDIDIPLFWGEQDLAMADASSTRCFSALVKDVEDDFAWLENKVFSADRAKFPEEVFSLDNWLWAVGIVVSRSFFVDGLLRLAPMVDFANHGDRPGDYKEVYGGGMAIFGRKVIKVDAGKDYYAGDEVLVSYGPKGSAAYVEELGFLPEVDINAESETSQSFVELEFEMREDDRLLDDKLDILEQQEMRPDQTFEIFSFGEPDPELLQYLRLVMLEGEDAFLMEAVFRGDVWGFMSEPVSQTNEKAMLDYLSQRCLAELAKMQQPISSSSSYRLRVCTELRTREMSCLERMVTWCRMDGEALDRKTYYQERRLRDLGLDGPLRGHVMSSKTVPQLTKGRLCALH
ncbi:unnamed protein product [Chrysoparadoxa australica]